MDHLSVYISEEEVKLSMACLGITKVMQKGINKQFSCISRMVVCPARIHRRLVIRDSVEHTAWEDESSETERLTKIKVV